MTKPPYHNTMTKTLTQQYHSLLLLLLSAALSHHRLLSHATSGGGSWELLQENIGVSAMHMQLMHNDRVVIFDRTDFGKSNISLPEGKCREDPRELVLKTDCTAHSVEYDVLSNTFRPLNVQTDTFCSSGTTIPNGQLIQTGGFNDGDKIVRIFNPCSDCDWKEVDALLARRWYATNHILPDGRLIIIGGRRQFNYEFYPKTGSAKNLYSLPFLVQTHDPKIENNLYPFVHLNVDGNLFIFANNRAILFDYAKNSVVRTYPAIPYGEPRNYPSTGSSVLLPLQGDGSEAEVLVCGGAPNGSFVEARQGNFLGALNTCGRIKITDANPQWTMETMPIARTMGDMVLLADGNVLIINGCKSGTAGWELGRDAVLNPVLYRPNEAPGSRFEVLNPSTIPRVYHSTAILLRDGRVLVGGSNPHVGYDFKGVLYPTELRLGAFSPPYLGSENTQLRPKITSPNSYSNLTLGQKIAIQFTLSGSGQGEVKVTMVRPPFTTHSYSMSQRLVVVGGGKVAAVGMSTYVVNASMPKHAYAAPLGYYLLFVIQMDVPSEGIWIHLV